MFDVIRFAEAAHAILDAGQFLYRQARSSAETRLHTVLYQVFSGVGAVLHTHSVNATVLSRLCPKGDSLTFGGYELQKAFPGIDTHETGVTVQVFDNTQEIFALADKTAIWFRNHPDHPGYLICGDGLYTWGQTKEDCLRHVEAFEFLMKCELESMRVRP